MASQATDSRLFTLERLWSPSSHTFVTPFKRIHDGEDLNFFLSSTGYRDLMTWLLQLNRSMFPVKTTDGQIEERRLDTPQEYSRSVQHLRDLVSDLSAFIEKAPPDTGPRRFGNVAFKAWFKLVDEGVDGLLNEHLVDVIRDFDQTQQATVIEEMKYYLLGSLGSPQRLDYGTGHELSFLAFLGCLWKLGAFTDGEESSIVIGVVQP